MATQTTADGRPVVRAEAKWLRITPRKARLTVEHIRGRTVPEARTVLAFMDRAAAREVEKVLRSAVANAEANHDLIGDELVVSAAYVDEGPMLKRWRARARGRVARIRKRTCHVTLKLTPLEAPPAVQVKPKRRRTTPEAADAEPQAKAPRGRRPKTEAAQAADAEPAEAAEGAEAATEEKPKRTRRKKKEE
jgi:large subunit ribosomal protein L22